MSNTQFIALMATIIAYGLVNVLTTAAWGRAIIRRIKDRP